MNDETRKALELFTTKAEELRRRDFLKYFEAEGKVGLNYHVNDDGTSKLEIVGPDEDAVLAFMANFRLFIQKGEPISFPALSKLIETDKELPRDWKRKYFEIREHLNDYLNQSPIQTEPPTKTPTRREIIDVIINGDIFHVKDEDKRRIFEKWLKSGIEFTLYINEFDLAVDYVAQIILHVSDLAKAELERSILKSA